VLALAIPLNLMLIVWMAVGRGFFGIITAWAFYLMVVAVGSSGPLLGFPVLSAGRALSAAGNAVTDRLDVVAVGVPDEGAEVAGVIFRPKPRSVQRLGA
jgi:hypothetical protein